MQLKVPHVEQKIVRKWGKVIKLIEPQLCFEKLSLSLDKDNISDILIDKLTGKLTPEI